jgi:threonine dehydrogenase-like Zn-dependent dehydrogenase
VATVRFGVYAAAASPMPLLQILPLEDAPRAYEIFQEKQDGAFKVLLK